MDDNKSKSQQRREEAMENAKPAVEAPKPTHRYFCEACTGVAFTCNLSDDKKAMDYPKTCHACGATIVIKPQNFIKL